MCLSHNIIPIIGPSLTFTFSLRHANNINALEHILIYVLPKRSESIHGTASLYNFQVHKTYEVTISITFFYLKTNGLHLSAMPT